MSDMNDRRYIKTEDIIRKAFIHLCKSNCDPTKISVKKLCDLANINRGTFYLHYDSIPHLIDHLEVVYAQKLIEAISLYNYDKNTLLFFNHIFDVVKDNPDIFYYHFYISNGTGHTLLESYLQEHMIPVWLERSKLNRHEACLVLKYTLTGGMEILKEWFKDNLKNEDEVKRIYEKIIKYGLYSMVYQEDQS